MGFTIEFTIRANEEIAHFRKAGNKAVLNKLSALMQELSEHPFTGTGKPEPLKHNLSGVWSRRINLEHRVLYEVNENTILILTVKGHY